MELPDIVARLRETGVEFEDVEVKGAAGGLPQSIAETMSAFANSRGGIIILGLDERTGFASAGVSDPVAIRDELAGVARTKLTPALAPIIDTVSFEGAILLLAEIEPLPPVQRPCYVTTRGLYNGAYVRVGDGDQRLTPYEIDRLRENSGQPRWDEEPVPRAALEDLDPRAVLRLIETASRNSPRAFSGLSDAETLARLGVLVSHEGTLVPSLAGLLSLGAYPQQFLPQLMISVAVYPHDDAGQPGPGGVRFLDSAAVGGAIPSMVTDTIQVAQRNLRKSSRVVGAGRDDYWEIEPEVIREAVVNALMHRDYSPQARGTQIQVELYPDRLTVNSPGGLFGNVRLETLGLSGTSSSRNARLAALLQEAGDPLTGRPVAENRGSGLRMMISQVMRDTGLVPLFAASLDDFRVTIPRTALVTREVRAWAKLLSHGQELSDTQISVLALANAGQSVGPTVLRRMGLSPSDARRQLGQLQDLGLLQARRARDDGSYRLAPGLPEIAPKDESGPPHGGGLADRILEVLNRTDSANREELQEATGASRSSVINALESLISQGDVEATTPSRSPNRRYWRSR